MRGFRVTHKVQNSPIKVFSIAAGLSEVKHIVT